MVGPAITAGLVWNRFWLGMGFAGLVISVLLFVLLPKQERTEERPDWVKGAVRAMGSVLRNPQSVLCGMIAGLLFIPTTIFGRTRGRCCGGAAGRGRPSSVSVPVLANCCAALGPVASSMPAVSAARRDRAQCRERRGSDGRRMAGRACSGTGRRMVKLQV